jgi:cell division ATPase FtsA
MFFSKTDKNKDGGEAEGRAALVFDFGSASVKILLCHYFEDRVEILSGAKVKYPQDAFDSEGEMLTEQVAGAIKKVLPGLLSQTANTNLPVIVGIGGLNVEGYASQINYRRAKKDKVIDQQEFQFILKRIEERAGQIITGMIAWETGQGQGAGLVNSEILDLSLDGYTVDSPVGLRGETLSCVVYNAYASQRTLRSLLRIVKLLGMQLFSITSSMYATLRSVLERYGQSASVVVLDIGGRLTEVGIVKGGRILGHQGFDVAGQSFTDSIVDELGHTHEEAEILKLGFSAGKLPGTAMKDIREIVSSDCKVFISGVELILKEFPGLHGAPEQFLLTGGGSLLPGLLSSMQATSFEPEKPSRAEMLLPKELHGFRDLTGLINSAADIGPLAVAADAVDLMREAKNPWSKWGAIFKK